MDGIEIAEAPPQDGSDSALKQEFEIMQRAKTIAAPTLDVDVRRRLRQLGLEVTLFGEGPYERRERLKYVLTRAEVTGEKLQEVVLPSAASIGSITTVFGTTLVKTVQSSERAPTGTFYTDGGPELLEARQQIADFSLRRAHKRLSTEREILLGSDPLELEDKTRQFLAQFQNSVETSSSQIGDERPLTTGRFSPQGGRFVTASWSTPVKIWNVPSCELNRTLRGHDTRVHAVSWHHSATDTDGLGDDESMSGGVDLATGSADGKIILWRLSQSNPALHIFDGHEDRINRLAFHPTGQYLASTSHDDTWRFWDVNTHQQLLLQEGHNSSPYTVKFHPDGSLVLIGDLGGHILVWDLRTGSCVAPLMGHVSQVMSLDINPTSPHQFASASEDRTARIWDLRMLQYRQTLLAHSKLVSECVYEPEFGRYLMTSSYDFMVKFWSTNDWSCVKIIKGHEGRIMGSDISPDGSMIGTVTFDRTWKLWTFAEG